MTFPDLPPRIHTALEIIRMVSNLRRPYSDSSVPSGEVEVGKTYTTLESEAIRLLRDYMRGALDIDERFYGTLRRKEDDGEEEKVPSEV